MEDTCMQIPSAIKLVERKPGIWWSKHVETTSGSCIFFPLRQSVNPVNFSNVGKTIVNHSFGNGKHPTYCIYGDLRDGLLLLYPH